MVHVYGSAAQGGDEFGMSRAVTALHTGKQFLARGHAHAPQREPQTVAAQRERCSTCLNAGPRGLGHTTAEYCAGGRWLAAPGAAAGGSAQQRQHCPTSLWSRLERHDDDCSGDSLSVRPFDAGMGLTSDTATHPVGFRADGTKQSCNGARR